MRPGDPEPEFAPPGFATPQDPVFDLPPVETLPPGPEAPLAVQIVVPIETVRLEGNTVFSDEELAALTAPFEGREVTLEELEELRFQLTRYYIERGYINSGAIIPDQEVADGVITYRIVEGRLTGVRVTGNDRLWTDYVAGRVAPDRDEPLNLQALQQNLQLLQQDPLIARINADLSPGVAAGEAELAVEVEEAPPYEIGFVVANNRPPSVGAISGLFFGTYRNLTGWGDSIALSYDFSEGTDGFNAAYAFPFNAGRTQVGVSYERNTSDVVEEPFDDLDIESDLETISALVDHAVILTPQQRLSLGLRFDRRRSETEVLGEGFPFSLGVEDDGVSKVSVLRFSQDWLLRQINQVIAARSTFSVGLPIFDATTNNNDDDVPDSPDGEFLAWLGQFQYARRFGDRGYQLIFRTDVQLSESSLLPLERFALGGADSVRGYRENQLVRDSALVSSVELRVPVFRLPIPNLSGPEEGQVQLAAFADYGRGWNVDVETPDPDDLASVGLGVRWDPTLKIHAELYWGYALLDVDEPEDDNLQDDGIHFRLEVAYP
ncbi:MAG: ShlB/FhaC/HecB family hemolysin secretion/activation protein [Candidatus Competibacterales bacterium]